MNLPLKLKVEVFLIIVFVDVFLITLMYEFLSNNLISFELFDNSTTIVIFIGPTVATFFYFWQSKKHKVELEHLD